MTHGESRRGKRSGEYRSWSAMLTRCYNSKNPTFKWYGARGIKVCARWRFSYVNFLADMGRRPLRHSLDRIDNNGNYEPSNCRWATPKEQARNQRSSRYITLNGSRKCLAEWAEITGIQRELISTRLQRGCSDKEALTPRSNWWDRYTLTVGGETKSYSNWAKLAGFPTRIIRTRLQRGWSAKDAVFRPLTPRGIRYARISR